MKVWIINKLWFRIVFFALLQPILPPSGIIPILLHEGAHWLAAVFLGASPTEIKIGWYGVGPGVEVPKSFPVQYLPYFRYAGGFTAGIVLLLVYIFVWAKLYKDNPTTFNWVIGVLTMFSSTLQFALGFMEGNWFEDYVRGTPSLQIAVIVGFLSAIVFHVIVSLLLYKLRKKPNKNNVSSAHDLP